MNNRPNDFLKEEPTGSMSNKSDLMRHKNSSSLELDLEKMNEQQQGQFINGVSQRNKQQQGFNHQGFGRQQNGSKRSIDYFEKSEYDVDIDGEPDFHTKRNRDNYY